MRCLFAQAMPVVAIPPAQDSIAATTDQYILARCPDHRINNASRLCKGLYLFPLLHIPDEHFPFVSAASTEQSVSIGTPGHTRYHPLMAQQLLQQGAIFA